MQTIDFILDRSLAKAAFSDKISWLVSDWILAFSFRNLEPDKTISLDMKRQLSLPKDMR
jgi:hypothetical protein